MDWQPINTAPDKVVVETKIDDASGVRNIQTLKRDRNMWWLPDGSMYVYYRPSHWRYSENAADYQRYITHL